MFKLRNVFRPKEPSELYQRINDITNLLQALQQNIQELINIVNQMQKNLQSISLGVDRNDRTIQDAVKVINSSTAEMANRVAQMNTIVNQFNDTSKKTY